MACDRGPVRGRLHGGRLLRVVDRLEAGRGPDPSRDLDATIEGRDVLIVEDIIDSGPHAVVPAEDAEGARDPRSLEVCALLTKARSS